MDMPTSAHMIDPPPEYSLAFYENVTQIGPITGDLALSDYQSVFLSNCFGGLGFWFWASHKTQQGHRKFSPPQPPLAQLRS